MTAESSHQTLEQWLDEFERAWKQGKPPAIREILERQRAAPQRSLSLKSENELLIELIRIDLEYRWRRAASSPRESAPLLDYYLNEFPSLRNDPDAFDELLSEEIRVRTRWGAAPDPGEYRQRFELLAPDLTGKFEEIRQEIEVESSLKQLFHDDAVAEFRPGGNEGSSPEAERLFEFLQQTPPFSELPDKLRRRIAEQCREEEFQPGDYLIRQGESATSMHIVLEGVAQISICEPDGSEREIARVGRHSVLGEIGLMTKEVRSANVKALNPVRTAMLGHNDFQTLLAEFPTLNVLFSELIAQRVGTVAVDIMYGKTISGYRFRERIGRGGMGIVYRAEDLETGEDVAVKMLRHDLVYDRQAAKRFVREAEVIRNLRHPNIIRVYREFSAFNTMFLSMELCPGPNLAEMISKLAPFPNAFTRKIVGQLSQALLHAHDAGVIHRDLKPANVMLTDEGLVKLTDFGLARSVQSLSLTQQGQLLGTPRYMPSELLSGADADHRADIYGLGCIVWEMITGEPLFPAKDIVELLRQQLQWQLPEPDQIASLLPGDLYRLLQQSLSQNVDERTLDLREVAGWAGQLPPASELTSAADKANPEPRSIHFPADGQSSDDDPTIASR